MDEFIDDFVTLAKTSDGQFFCSDPIDTSRTNPIVTVKGIARTNQPCTVEVHVFVPPRASKRT
jgi:hypothetical protein